MRTITAPFYFRSFPLGLASSLPVGIKPATQEQLQALATYPNCFERATADFQDNTKRIHTLDAACRKAVEANLTIPELADIPQDSKLLASIIEKYVLAYVKQNYVDKYLAVGAHDWATLEQAFATAQEATGGFSACPYTDEQFATAQAIFTAYLDKVAPKLGAACVKLVANRTAKRQVQSALAKFGYSEKTLAKLLERFIECIATLAEDSTEAKVLTYCAERIATLIEAERTAIVDDSDM